MRARLPLLLTFLLFTTSVFAKEVWLAVSGTANGVFFSDARIFNPNDKEITVQAYYLPRGNGNNSGEQPVSFTVPKREMKISDDIVATVLHRGDVGGIRFVCPDDFVVTQRIYALTTGNCGTSSINPCTLGQFVQGLDVSTALTKGVLLQLKSNDKFRTNIGAANPNNAAAKVTWRLYDKNNALVATSSAPVEMPPYAVIGPTGITSSTFYNVAPTVDLSDAWVSFTSDLPIFAYGSVVDNGSTDQTYVPASADSGTPANPAPQEETIVTVTARDFVFTVNTTATLHQHDTVKFKIVATQGTHGFEFVDPNGNPLIVISQIGTTVNERTVVLPVQGTYVFFCTNTSCGEGHTSMVGEIVVGSPSPGGPDKY